MFAELNHSILWHYRKTFCKIQTGRSWGWGPCLSLPPKACVCIFTWWNNKLSLSFPTSLPYLTSWNKVSEISPGLQMNILFIHLSFPSFYSSTNNYIFLIITFGVNPCCTCTLCRALAAFQCFQWLWKEESGTFTLFAVPISPFFPLAPSCLFLSYQSILNPFFHMSH